MVHNLIPRLSLRAKVLQATESWAGPGNEASCAVMFSDSPSTHIQRVKGWAASGLRARLYLWHHKLNAEHSATCPQPSVESDWSKLETHVHMTHHSCQLLPHTKLSISKCRHLCPSSLSPPTEKKHILELDVILYYQGFT